MHNDRFSSLDYRTCYSGNNFYLFVITLPFVLTMLIEKPEEHLVCKNAATIISKFKFAVGDWLNQKQEMGRHGHLQKQYTVV